MGDKPELIYVGDPMCSWCWGIAPVLDKLAERNDIDMRIIVGGLRPGPQAQPLDDRMKSVLGGHWAKVEKVTGQPFNPAGLERDGWTYDTELPAVAVTTMRQIAPEHTLAFFKSLQQAFYAEAIDITDPAEYPALVSGFPVDAPDFVAALASEEGRKRAWEDFAEARELGVAGFPTVLLRLDDSTQVLSRGYASLDHFENQLTYWVEGRQPDSASAYTCSIDGATC